MTAPCPSLPGMATGLLALCRARNARIATAESCTGGLVAAALTAIPGSSDVFDRAFVTYSNEAKTEMLGVPAGLIAAAGAVSEAVARHMAAGALRRSNADLAVAVTGIAGPGGGSIEKPVGLVWFSVSHRSGHPLTELKVFRGERSDIRGAATRHAIRLLAQIMEGND